MTKPAEKYYDHLSTSYDSVSSKQGVWTPPKIMAQQISPLLQDGAKLLDIGIGTGQLVGFLRKFNKNLKIEGVEISKKMSDICLSKYPDVIIHHGDILEIDFSHRDDFNMITICGALEFISELNLLFEKCWRLLAKSGYLVFTYEPVIVGHRIQGEEKSLTVASSTENQQYIKDFFTYRYSPWQIYQALRNIGFECKSDTELVAYRKKETDIIYHLIIARKKN